MITMENLPNRHRKEFALSFDDIGGKSHAESILMRAIQKVEDNCLQHGRGLFTHQTISDIDHEIRVYLTTEWYLGKPVALSVAFEVINSKIYATGWIANIARAHWLYKEKQRDDERRLKEEQSWARELLETKNKFNNDIDIINQCSSEFRSLVARALQTHSRELSSRTAATLSEILDPDYHNQT